MTDPKFAGVPMREEAFRGDRFFLSNFYPCTVVVIDEHETGIYLPSSEHAFVWYKLRDPLDRPRVLLATTPGEAKRVGRSQPCRLDWDAVADNGRLVKINVMERVLGAKFDPECNPDLCRRLMDTGVEYLVETNWWKDRFWGVCEGRGENWLGRLLMERRDRLREVA